MTKTLSGTRGRIKNDATHKVCTSTSTELALGEFTKEQFEFKNSSPQDGIKEDASHKSKRKKKKKEMRKKAGEDYK